MKQLPRLLDLFCRAGGSSVGFHRAGFEVVGVDKYPQPHYPFEFHLGDALEYLAAHWGEFDAFGASPPCQFGSEATPKAYRKNHINYIPEIRRLLQKTGKPYVIENVENVRRWLINPILLCGTMFDLPIWRHRYFEIWPLTLLLVPPCRHEWGRIADIDGLQVIEPVLCTGGGDGRRSSRKTHRPRGKAVDIRAAMGIDWMNQGELTEAIPPAYTEFIGKHLMSFVQQLLRSQ